MNKYLLLRDNKQSGPYSVSELASFGLKAYDLVWLEGKSAAWRYPSEIEELKPYAPIVEEQPFDRFYKKTESKPVEPAFKKNTPGKENDVVREEPKPVNISSLPPTSTGKKIHVSLPGGGTPAQSSPVQPSKSVQPSFLEKPTPVEPVQPQPVLEVKTQVPVFVQQTENFEEAYRKRMEQKVTPLIATKEAPVSKLLFRSVAAACLLLGGALIGLIINYNSQQQKFQKLNQLVEEIKQQDNPGTSKVAKPDAVEPAQTKTEVVPPVAEDQPLYKEEIQLPQKKDRTNQKQQKPIADTSQLNEVPEVEQVVSKQAEATERMDRLATETTKKNLWQLVTVNHNDYKTGVFGGISNLSLKLSNRSLFQLQQVEVELLFLSPEKKTVNKQKVVFENVAPGEQLVIDIPKSNRGVKIDYVIKKISTKEFELAHAGM